jgi:hypothetical protein
MDFDEDGSPLTRDVPVVTRATTPAIDSLSPDLPQHPRISTFRDVGIRMNSRKRTINTRGFGTGWLDEDKSGNYDPRLHRTPPRRAKRIRTNKGRSPSRRTGGRRLPVGYRYLVTVPLKSEKALNFLRSITPSPLSSRSDREDDLSSSPSDNGEGFAYRTRREIRRPKQLGRSTSVRLVLILSMIGPC